MTENFCFNLRDKERVVFSPRREENKILITTQLLMSLSDEFSLSLLLLIRNMEIVKAGEFQLCYQ